jgi:predicted dehydrogenase
MKERLDVILIGAGQRGAEVFGAYGIKHPREVRFVAVAEPDETRRVRFGRRHAIPAEMQFSDWEPLLEKGCLGEAALICTPDWLHTQPALEAMRAGYPVLLEKPMATRLEDCLELVQMSQDTGQQLHICHVLRYTQHYRRMREIVQSGQLGQVVNIDQRENVSWWHMAHSYVRGNWRSETQSSPMILAKCCHDLDIIPWVLDRNCLSLSSVGSLVHYRAENAPLGAAKRCLDDCAVSDTCPYYAPFVYGLAPLWRSMAGSASGFQRVAIQVWLKYPGMVRLLDRLIPALQQISHHQGWPLSVLASEPTPENVLQALRDGPYGRCVYHCDNDVVDHQVVSMAFEGGISATLTMHGHSFQEYRTTRIEGSQATLRGEFGLGGSKLILDEHRSGKRVVVNTSNSGSGHGGGDAVLMKAFLLCVKEGVIDAQTTAEKSLQSHRMAFAAEEARLNKKVIDMTKYMNYVWQETAAR